jgi:hypothetical protein
MCDRDIIVTACGRICLHRKKINLSTVLAGQRLGIREVDDGIWLVSMELRTYACAECGHSQTYGVDTGNS